MPCWQSKLNWTKMSNGLWYHYWILIWSCSKLLSAVTLIQRINTAWVMLNLMLNYIKWCWRTISRSFFLLYFPGQQSVDKKIWLSVLSFTISGICDTSANLNQTCQKHGTSFHDNELGERGCLRIVPLWEWWWVFSLLPHLIHLRHRSARNQVLIGEVWQRNYHFSLPLLQVCVCVFILQIKLRVKYQMNAAHCFQSSHLVILVSLLLCSEFSA